MIAKMATSTLPGRPLFVGIDVAKNSHIAAFISGSLLTQHKRYEACPTLPFENNKAGFDTLLADMSSHAPLESCLVLMEKTGHYHKPLAAYLMNAGIAVYEIHVQKRPARNKSDKRDALNLANTLYSQIGLGAQIANKASVVHAMRQPSEAAMKLRGLVGHREDLTVEMTQLRNKLTAIADQLFFEAHEVIRDLNGPTALIIRERFPTPADVSCATLQELRACRVRQLPNDANLLRLKELAGQSVGLANPAITEALTFEQGQLITELRLLREHAASLDEKIAAIVERTREGQILLSLGIMGPTQAGAIIAAIDTIANFERASQLKEFFGWAPNQDQTGISRDSMALTSGGNRSLRKTLYLIGWMAVSRDTEWRELYGRLIPQKCAYDARTKKYKGKNKVLGRVIGQIITLMFHLLKKDHNTLAALRPGETPPTPVLYDRAIHQDHRQRHK